MHIRNPQKAKQRKNKHNGHRDWGNSRKWSDNDFSNRCLKIRKRDLQDNDDIAIE